MARIPEDIFYLEILPRLPYDSLFRFKFVCKSWLHFITRDPSFARQHLSYNGSPGFMYVQFRRTIEFQPINIFGELNICNPTSFSISDGLQNASIITSTNGLILFRLHEGSPYENIYYVWNLMTNEVQRIPISFGHHREHVLVGLAFEPSDTSIHYKVVEIIEERQQEFYKYKFKIYSSNIGMWVMSDQKLIMERIYYFSNIRNVLYKNGVIYWNFFPYILWFDLIKNISNYILTPTIENVRNHLIGMTDDGFLTLVQLAKHYHLIWMMNNDGEWVNRYVVNNNNIIDEYNCWHLPYVGGDRLHLVSKAMGCKNVLYYEDMTTGELMMEGEMKDCDMPPVYTFFNYSILTRIGSLQG